MVLDQAGDELFVHALHDVAVAGALDDEEQGKFAVDLGDLTVGDDGGQGERIGAAGDVGADLVVGDADGEFYDVEVAGEELAGTFRAEIDGGPIAEEAGLLEFLAFASDGFPISSSNSNPPGSIPAKIQFPISKGACITASLPHNVNQQKIPNTHLF